MIKEGEMERGGSDGVEKRDIKGNRDGRRCRYGADETKMEKWQRRRKKTEMEGRDKYRGRSQIKREAEMEEGDINGERRQRW